MIIDATGIVATILVSRTLKISTLSNETDRGNRLKPHGLLIRRLRVRFPPGVFTPFPTTHRRRLFLWMCPVLKAQSVFGGRFYFRLISPSLSSLGYRLGYRFTRCPNNRLICRQGLVIAGAVMVRSVN